MYNSILLTIDTNQPASWAKALPHALELCKGWGAKLHVLSVVPTYGLPVVEGFFPADFESKAIHKAGEDLKALLEKLLPENQHAEAHVRAGVVHDEILAAIGAIGADLVVMGSHPPDRMRDFLVGSNADRVVRHSPVSVLVVR
jgi:nucleotide-binding universal stress UspA family protein